MENGISNIAISKLSNGSHYNFIQIVVERAEEDEGLKAKLSSDIAALKAAFEREGECIRTLKKSELTRLISENDSLRDGCYNSYKSVVKSLLAVPNGDIKNAAERLWDNLKHYNIHSSDSLDQQTGLMMSLIDGLETKYKNEVATLGISTLVAVMKEANEKVHTLMFHRNTEQSKKVPGATKAARAATDNAYRKLISKVNALVLLEGGEPYLDFINTMNAQIARYKREAISKPSSKNEA